MDKNKSVRLYWWSKQPNFGDCLSPWLIEKISGSPVLFDQGNKNNNLLAIGSIISWTTPKSTVWGSGLFGTEFQEDVSKKMTFSKEAMYTAVRGPLTRNLLKVHKVACPPIYGDPGLLVPLFHHSEVEKTHEVGWLIRWSESDTVNFDVDPGIKKIYLKTDNIEETLNEILSCKRIASSSLHGIILADAYGIPSAWLYSKKSLGLDFKYYDYMLSVNKIQNIQSLCYSKYEKKRFMSVDDMLTDIRFDDRNIEFNPIPLLIACPVGEPKIIESVIDKYYTDLPLDCNAIEDRRCILTKGNIKKRKNELVKSTKINRIASIQNEYKELCRLFGSEPDTPQKKQKYLRYVACIVKGKMNKWIRQGSPFIFDTFLADKYLQKGLIERIRSNGYNCFKSDDKSNEIVTDTKLNNEFNINESTKFRGSVLDCLNSLSPESLLDTRKVMSIVDKSWMQTEKRTINLNEIRQDMLNEDTRFRIECSGVGYESLFFAHPQKKLYVSFSSGRKLSSQYPQFVRWKYRQFFDGNMLFIDDPQLEIYNDRTKVMWYYGTKDHPYTYDIAKIILKFAEILGVSAQDICVFGSSCGATVSIQIGNLIDGISVIAINPQYRIGEWLPEVTDFFSSIGIDLKGPDPFNRHHLKLKQKNTIYFLVENFFSPRDRKQFLPFFKENGLPIRLGLTKTNNILTYLHGTIFRPNPHHVMPDRIGFLMILYLLEEYRKGKDMEAFRGIMLLFSEMFQQQYDSKLKIAIQKKTLSKYKSATNKSALDVGKPHGRLQGLMSLWTHNG